MNIELIHKLGKDNLVLDELSRKEEFVRKKLYDTMSVMTIICCNNLFFIEGIKEVYEVDEDVLKIKKAFASIKTMRKQRRLMEVSSTRNGLI